MMAQAAMKQVKAAASSEETAEQLNATQDLQAIEHLSELLHTIKAAEPPPEPAKELCRRTETAPASCTVTG